MEDEPAIVEQIDRLAEEQRQLREDGPDDQALLRIAEIETELNRLWDLLRQGRAKEDAGLDPDDASLRSGETVDDYLN